MHLQIIEVLLHLLSLAVIADAQYIDVSGLNYLDSYRRSINEIVANAHSARSADTIEDVAFEVYHDWPNFARRATQSTTGFSSINRRQDTKSTNPSRANTGGKKGAGAPTSGGSKSTVPNVNDGIPKGANTKGLPDGTYQTKQGTYKETQALQDWFKKVDKQGMQNYQKEQNKYNNEPLSEQKKQWEQQQQRNKKLGIPEGPGYSCPPPGDQCG